MQKLADYDGVSIPVRDKEPTGKRGVTEITRINPRTG